MDKFSEMINKKISPREDFYSYVNDKWFGEVKIPDDQGSIGTFRELIENLRRDIETILTSPLIDKSRNLKIFYNSIMDEKKKNEIKDQPLQPIFQIINKIRTINDILNHFIWMDKHMNHSPIRLISKIDEKNSSIYIFYLQSRGYSLPTKDFYLDPNKEQIRASYLDYLSEIIKDFNLKINPQEILNFETKMSEVYPEQSDIRNNPEITYNKMKIDQLSNLMDIDWHEHIRKYNEDYDLDYVICMMPEVVSRTFELLNEYSVAFWREFLKYQTIRYFSQFLSDERQQQHFKFFRNTLYGTPKMSEIWKKAQSLINFHLGHELGKLYIQKYFPDSSKVEVEKIIKNIIKSTKNRIKKLKWMQEASKKIAFSKCENLKIRIGYPEKWKDYSKLILSENYNLVENIIELNSYNKMLNIKRAGLNPDPKEWEDFDTLNYRTYPQMVNAWFVSSTNNIVFPAGILQYPFFDTNFNEAEIYGAIGAVIAHEITHGFDARGRKYDENGNLNNWWNIEDNEQFEKNAKYYIDEYSSYDYYDEKVNGELTLSENLADHGGILISYHAMKENVPEIEIDGFSNSERFFMSWARIWRRKTREAFGKTMLAIDSHAPGYWRVNGTLSNIKEFHETYNVREGDDLFRKDPPQFW